MVSPRHELNSIDMGRGQMDGVQGGLGQVGDQDQMGLVAWEVVEQL